jgi:hypothetical protein
MEANMTAPDAPRECDHAWWKIPQIAAVCPKCGAIKTDASVSVEREREKITLCDTHLTKRWGWWCSAHNKPAYQSNDGNYYCARTPPLSQGIEAYEIERDARELETGKHDPQGAVNYWQMAANHANEEVTKLIAERDKLKEACDGYLAHAANLRGEHAKLEERVSVLEGALQAIADGIPRPTEGVTIYRKDGKISKHDKCKHDLFMWEGCNECISDFARAALRTSEDA